MGEDKPTPASRRLWVKLLLAYLVPTALIATGMGWLAYRAARGALEEQFGDSLVAVARTGANLLAKQRAVRLEPGDEGSRTYANLHEKLAELRTATGVQRIYLFDHQGRALVDSDGSWAIGEPIVKLAADRTELKMVFGGRPSASLLFVGRDGLLTKSGFAPVVLEGAVVAAVGADGSAVFFEPLSDLGRTLALVAGLALALIALVTWGVSRGITRPVARLAEASRAIGRGELGVAIAVETRDEIGQLARTLNEMRQSIFERDRELQMMLSGIAHEVRNPLGGMSLFVGLLREELADHPSASKHLDRVATELDYLSRVVNDFLDFARQRPLQVETLEPRAELEELRALCGSDLEAAGVTLTVEVAADIGAIDWDRERMRRALLNLVRNAIQASTAGSEVAVRLRREGPDWLLEVADRGSGIPPDKQAHVFEAFYTTRQQGTGLGLALVRRIAEAHGGTVDFVSEAGRGTTFTLRLPTARSPGAREADPWRAS